MDHVKGAGSADGFRTPSLLQQLEELEAKKGEPETELQAPSPAPVRFHPGLADLYRQKIDDLVDALSDPSVRVQAAEAMRSLIS